MGKLIRCITSDGSVAALAADSTDVVGKAEKIHVTSAVTTAALGRLLTAASLMGSNMKGTDDSLTLKVNGGGPSGSVIAVADSGGNVRGYVQNPIVEIPLNKYGKLDVGGAVGKDGYLTVMKDLGLKEPYIGQVPLVSGEIAEDITSYYAVSEQIPTVCALGVLVDRDLSVKAAGGFLIQLLPMAGESVIERLESNIEKLPSVTSMLSGGMGPMDILNRAMEGFELEVLDETDIAYRCNCSRERVERALVSIGKKELQKIADEDEVTELSCHFCNKKYSFSNGDVRRLLAEM